ncbi:MAG: D-alanine--D-alanine ligase [Candidatus Pacebacteria bacterium]|nr:D-alanine--D-alanine ligase [Candidatus Paceibacterota bacterium]
MSSRPTVAVLFGSRSVEHEVSVVTAMQILANIDRNKYNVVPVYIDKQGRWLTGKGLENLESFKSLALRDASKFLEISPSATPTRAMIEPLRSGLLSPKIPRIDVVFPALHGTFGEDGTVQGLLELANIPYVGCGVTASAVGMDKVLQKAIFKQVGLNVVKHSWFFRETYQQNPESIIKNLEKELPYPMIVKPANLGSSVGITLAKNRETLQEAIEVAQAFDRKILVEEVVQDMIEINCSVLGWKTLEASVCEQPVKHDEFLSYKDKYMGGGKKAGTKDAPAKGSSKGMASLARLVPAPIPEPLAKQIQEMAKVAFRSIDGSGIARIDFMVTTTRGKVTPQSKVYINEINTLPGSFSFYLWEATGVQFVTLIDKLIDIAIERQHDKNTTTFSIDSKLLG